jgi:K+-transporting ATPase KdpF subunit
MNSIIVLVMPVSYEMNSPTGYAIGAAIALLILGYLVYSLIKPERF